MTQDDFDDHFDFDLDLASAAAAAPARAAVVMAGGGTVLTYAELDERSNRLAQLLASRGLRKGDCLAILLENHVRFLEVAWAAQRSGLYYTAINSHLTVDEARYVVDNSRSKALVSSVALSSLADGLGPEAVPGVETRLMIDGVIEGWESFEDAVSTAPAAPLAGATEGDMMLYSSGTTGRPKGIRRPLQDDGDVMKRTARFLRDLMGFCPGDVYLSPAPLYHTAPLSWSMGVHRLGGTVVVMERFDARTALELIETHGVTHSQWVPTMFVRMLKLDAATRDRYDLSSHRAAVHAAAPCPIPVKRQMIEWWGPILYEYYSGTEGAGVTFIDSERWLRSPGSVGRPLIGTAHILDDEGNELPPGEIGDVYFGGSVPFEYFGDPEKTSGAWRGDLATMGDVGYVDDGGFVYLTDRKAHMIISGGVNIYPQEAENVLVTHPRVADAAVFGIPNDDLGEEAKAVVEPLEPAEAGDALAGELMAFCRRHLAGYKCPRSVEFTDALPRLPTGKLAKHLLVERYRSGEGAESSPA